MAARWLTAALIISIIVYIHRICSNYSVRAFCILVDKGGIIASVRSAQGSCCRLSMRAFHLIFLTAAECQNGKDTSKKYETFHKKYFSKA